MILRTVHSVTAAVLVLSVSSSLSASNWYVDGSATQSGNGTSWASAFQKIQEGIDAASNGDTVAVAEGTYIENIHFHGKNIVLTSTDPLDPDVVRNTVIDGDDTGAVVRFSGTEGETCVLSGFTIRNGTGTLGPDGVIYGGGICGWDPRPRPVIQNNIIAGNSAHLGGGIAQCAGVIQNCIITGNSAGSTSPNWCGGGIAFCDGVIQNNLIVGNVGPCGGGISFSNPDFRNNIVVGNTAPGNHGGGLAHLGTSPYSPPGGSISNCIIWGNTSATGPQVHDSLAPSHCCIQDWTGGGEENIALNPQFVDPDGPDDDPSTFDDNDYRLSATSSCIDAGTNEDWMNGGTDLDGNPRILIGLSSLTVDIGAYEYRFAIQGLTRQPEGTVEFTWDHRAGTRYAIWSCMSLSPDGWIEEDTILPKESVARWTDTDTAAPRKFYRIEIR